MQPVIKWTGSKRSQAAAIKSYFPEFKRYIEPFVGGGSMVYAVAPECGCCGDVCLPLIELWWFIQKNPNHVYEQYKMRWEHLNENQQAFYHIRTDFNKTGDCHDFFFLSRTCVNGLIRFNKKGEFNSSLHLTRKGIEPDRLKPILEDWSYRIRNVTFRHVDYNWWWSEIEKGDFVYLDPPYFHTKGMYYGQVGFNDFMRFLYNLNAIGVKYALSLDGTQGDIDYKVELPKELYKRHIMLPSGNCTFKKVMNGKREKVLESLYLNY